jgi:peptidoglycan L-alanyl-D-glutamate endopeptidase CwlK
MSLSDEQYQFAKDFSRLMWWLTKHPKVTKFTIGEVERTLYQQRRYVEQGKSWTLDSNHLKKKAGHLNVWIDGELTWEKEDLQFIGDYWESLDEKNQWGGNWKNTDTPHYERT